MKMKPKVLMNVLSVMNIPFNILKDDHLVFKAFRMLNQAVPVNDSNDAENEESEFNWVIPDGTKFTFGVQDSELYITPAEYAGPIKLAIDKDERMQFMRKFARKIKWFTKLSINRGRTVTSATMDDCLSLECIAPLAILKLALLKCKVELKEEGRSGILVSIDKDSETKILVFPVADGKQCYLMLWGTE